MFTYNMLGTVLEIRNREMIKAALCSPDAYILLGINPSIIKLR